QYDLAGLALERAVHTRRIRSAFARHWSDDDSSDRTVHLIGRNDDARPSLLNLASQSRIQLYEEDVEAFDYHSHSSSSQELPFETSESRRRSSPASAIERKARVQSARGFSAPRMMICPS